MDKYTEIQKELNRLAKEYSQIEDTSKEAKSKKIRIFNNAARVFLGDNGSESKDINPNLNLITKRGKLNELKNTWNKNISNCKEIIDSACLETFSICFTNYDPLKNDNFMAYFYASAYYNAKNALDSTAKTLGIIQADKPKELVENTTEFDEKQYSYTYYVDYSHDITDYELSSDRYELEDKYDNKERFAKLMSSFASSIIIFCEHRNTQKSSVATALKYYKTFYTGDIIHLSKIHEFIVELSRHEQKIRKSYNEDFIDYVLKDEPRSLSEIAVADLKLYKELNDSRVANSKIKKEIKLPIENMIYSLFFDVTKPLISKKHDEYTDFMKESMVL